MTNGAPTPMDSDHGDVLGDSEAGWECARLLTLARATAARAEHIEDQLRGFDPVTLNAENGAILSRSEFDSIVADTLALHETAEIMGFIANRLGGRQETLIVAADDVRAAAAHGLAAGTADPAFAMSAVRMLRTAEGFPAIAEAITAEANLLAQWGTITSRDLLTALADGDEAQIEDVCRTAHIDPDAPLSGLDLMSVQQFAEALRAADV